MYCILRREYAYRRQVNRVLLFAVLLVSLALVCIYPQFGFAQRPKPSPGNSIAITVESIQENIEKVERSKDLDDATKTSILNLYQEAIQDVIRAASWVEKSKVFEQSKRSAARDIEQAKAMLAENARTATADVPHDASVKHIERALAEANARFSEAKKKLSAAEAEPRRRVIRRLEVERLING